jgi:predicted amidohydrolase
MGRYLNVGIIQMPVSTDTSENFRYLEERTENLMKAFHKPELVVGVESIGAFTPDTIPGRISEYFGRIAKKHGIYFIPGTLSETEEGLSEGAYYNTAVVFGPDGSIVGKYRKMAPWRPAESATIPGREYFVFDIPEKNTKVGVQICYDINFPEISRNETLMGAEVLVKLTMDPDELYALNRHIHFARALENQAYVVSTNATGFFNALHLYGSSIVVGPEGNVLWEGGREPAMCTVTLDLDVVSRCRKSGTMFLDYYLKHLHEFNFPMPYAGDFREAPLLKQLGDAPGNPAEYDENIKEIWKGPIGRRAPKKIDFDTIKENLARYLDEKGV